jgi:hypothetical protein
MRVNFWPLRCAVIVAFGRSTGALRRMPATCAAGIRLGLIGDAN